MGRTFRFFLAFIVLVSVAAAALFILGNNRGRFSTSLMIDAPPATVFLYLTDAQLQKQWVDGLVDVKLLGDGAEPLGSKSKVTIESNGRTTEFDDEVIRYKENELLTVKSTNSLIARTSVYQLESRDDSKTYLTYRVKTANLGVAKFIGPFIATPIQEKIETDARRLKELVEKKTGESTESAASESVTSANSETNDQ